LAIGDGSSVPDVTVGLDGLRWHPCAIPAAHLLRGGPVSSVVKPSRGVGRWMPRPGDRAVRTSRPEAVLMCLQAGCVGAAVNVCAITPALLDHRTMSEWRRQTIATLPTFAQSLDRCPRQESNLRPSD